MHCISSGHYRPASVIKHLKHIQSRHCLTGKSPNSPRICADIAFQTLHGPSMFAVKAKIYGVHYKQSSSIAFDETSSYCSAPKNSNFSAFHWSPRGILVSIGQHFVATKAVHLRKSTESSLITESDQSGPNHQL